MADAVTAVMPPRAEMLVKVVEAGVAPERAESFVTAVEAGIWARAPKTLAEYEAAVYAATLDEVWRPWPADARERWAALAARRVRLRRMHSAYHARRR